MDPTANLLEQLDIAVRLTDDEDGDVPQRSHQAIMRDGHRLAELVAALDGWLKGGGLLPMRWQGPVARRRREDPGAAMVGLSQELELEADQHRRGTPEWCHLMDLAREAGRRAIALRGGK
jgi:hypothetical protein